MLRLLCVCTYLRLIILMLANNYKFYYHLASEYSVEIQHGMDANMAPTSGAYDRHFVCIYMRSNEIIKQYV